jgi:hypothetical protein
MLLSLAGFLLLAGSASAKDRNHDRIPDRWEKRHHLSLHVNQARRDQDHDGLRNRAEFRAKLNPRDDDSDNDGLEDGDENAGTILSFANGVLKISVFGDQVMSGTVTDATEIECEQARDEATTASDDDPGDDHGDDADGRGKEAAIDQLVLVHRQAEPGRDRAETQDEQHEVPRLEGLPRGQLSGEPVQEQAHQ